MKLLIKGGVAIDPAQGLNQERDVLVEDGCVAAVAERVEAMRMSAVRSGRGVSALGQRRRRAAREI